MISVGDTTLTPAEREFAEANHGLLIRFMRSYHLDDELYGQMSIRYLKTVQRYLNSEKLRRKYRFSTILWYHLHSELSNIMRASGRAPPVVSYDQLFHEPPSFDLTGATDLWDYLADQLTEKQLDVLRLRYDGHTYSEIAKNRGITFKAVARRFDRIRRKLHIYLTRDA